MSGADVRTTLRVIAVAIAILAVIDPEFPIVDAASRPVVVVKAATVDVAATQRALQESIANRELVTREVTNGRLPCASE